MIKTEIYAQDEILNKPSDAESITALMCALLEQALDAWDNGEDEPLLPPPPPGSSAAEMIWNMGVNALAYGFMKGMLVCQNEPAKEVVC